MRKDEYPIIDKYVRQEINRVLDALRADIEKVAWEDSLYSFDGSEEVRIPCLDPDDVFEIIDKYKEGGADCESTSKIKETEK